MSQKKLSVFLSVCAALTFACAPMALGAPPMTVYVTTNGTGLGYPNWADATNNIQTAIDIISNSTASTVWVSNGVYNTGGVTNYPLGYILTNRVAITKAITVRSANNNPATTIIVGAKDPANGGTNGPAAVRCVYTGSGSSLIGFTLTNGATIVSPGVDGEGGGVYGYPASIISNCVITGNLAYSGGGANSGTLRNCTVVGNSAVYGGGMFQGTMYNCLIVGNSVGDQGGGGRNSTFYNCTIISNSAVNYGGGTSGGTVYNCLIIRNSAPLRGGGAYGGTLYNCTVVSNLSNLGGGVRGGLCINCIVYYNGNNNLSNYDSSTVTFSNSCTFPVQGGWASGNITNAPMFVSMNAGNYRLSQGSPCINAGNNAYVTTATDLDGHQRLDHYSRIVDMGCYEFLGSGSMYTVPGF